LCPSGSCAVTAAGPPAPAPPNYTSSSVPAVPTSVTGTTAHDEGRQWVHAKRPAMMWSGGGLVVSPTGYPGGASARGWAYDLHADGCEKRGQGPECTYFPIGTDDLVQFVMLEGAGKLLGEGLRFLAPAAKVTEPLAHSALRGVSAEQLQVKMAQINAACGGTGNGFCIQMAEKAAAELPHAVGPKLPLPMAIIPKLPGTFLELTPSIINNTGADFTSHAFLRLTNGMVLDVDQMVIHKSMEEAVAKTVLDPSKVKTVSTFVLEFQSLP